MHMRTTYAGVTFRTAGRKTLASVQTLDESRLPEGDVRLMFTGRA